MRTLTLVALSSLLAPGLASSQEPWEPAFHAGDLRVEATGYVQLDLRSYPNWEALEANRDEPNEFRRVRFGAQGEWRRILFEVDFDPSDEDREHVKDAYVDVELADALRVRGGNFKLPFSPELLRSGSKLDFIERALPVDRLRPARDLGVMLHGEFFDRLFYEAGVFAGDGRKRFERAGRTAAARLGLEAFDGLTLGASFTDGTVEAAPEDPSGSSEPKGFSGRSPTGFLFFSRHFVSGRRQRFDAEVELVKGPFAIRGEFLQSSEERLGQGALFDDLPDVEAKGWFVSATWLVTGEKKRRTIRPDDPLPRGVGAVEIGARVEALRFDDVGSPSSFEGAGNRTRNVRPGEELVLTGGVSWWPSRFVRVMTNVVVDRYADALFAPEPGRRGNYVSLLSRIQLMLP